MFCKVGPPPDHLQQNHVGMLDKMQITTSPSYPTDMLILADMLEIHVLVSITNDSEAYLYLITISLSIARIYQLLQTDCPAVAWVIWPSLPALDHFLKSLDY